MSGLRDTSTPEFARSESPLFVNSVAKAFAVLMAFGSERRSMSLPEIAEATGMGKSAAQRFAFTLEALGYLRRDPSSRRYRAAPRMLELGVRYVLADELVEYALPLLSELNRRCMETVNLSRPDGVDMVCVARFPGYKQVTSHMPLGMRLPMYCTSVGRAFLSALPQGEQLRLIEASNLRRFTPNTVTDPARLAVMISNARHDGFATAIDEYYRGDIAIGAPVFDSRGTPVAAINISVPMTRWKPEEAISQLAPFVIETAHQVSGNPDPRRLAPPGN
jgi:IclR family transcriptional regulator, pca regulon regulatory protein